ncbi:protein amalgam-like isoform X2 [Planococcus citri]|uniref:protein amalgam-like isoform X2 n=1 Tax=Planococcus citri TaxID=170843 RepID=UPI0031F7B5D4
MRFVLGIFLIGLLFNSGYGKPAPAEEEEDGYLADDNAQLGKGNPTISTQPQDFVAQPGDEIVLPCVVENNVGEDAVVWKFGNNANNVTVTLFIDAHKVGSHDAYTVEPNHTLRIRNFRNELAGSYTCAIPQSPTAQSQIPEKAITHVVGPKEKVVVEAIIGNKKYIENLSGLNITCRVKGFPTPMISWSKKNSENSVEQDLGTKSTVYNIRTVTFSDSGIYICRADNGQSFDSKSTVVQVITGVGPESSKVYPSDVEGATKLCCVFDANRKMNWVKDGKAVPNSDRFSIEEEKHKNCLVIKKPKEEDLGVYTCQSEKSSEHAEIELNGAPGKPVLQSVHEDDAKNPVATWSVSSLLPISEYKIYSKKVEESEWKEVEHKSLSATDKKNEITYTFSSLTNGQYSVKLEVSNRHGPNESIDNAALVVAKINSNGAESQYRISSLCVLFVILMRLWSC